MSQSKYAHDILLCADFLNIKPVSTPLTPSQVLRVSGTPSLDHTLYRSLVGALQYLTITRPDFSYVVNIVNKFQSAPTIDHFQAVK